MMKLNLVLALIALPTFAAITATTQWEVRGTGGSSNNGGGFDGVTIAGGTDRSQSSSAAVHIDNSAIKTTCDTTTALVFTQGYTPTVADMGNVVNVLAGTNDTTGRYQITGWSSTSWTLDRAPCTASGTITSAYMGGAVDTISHAAAAAGNTVWVKGPITLTAAPALLTAAIGSPIIYEGYTTTRGDGYGTPAVLTYSGSGIGVSLYAYDLFRNFTLDCANQATSTGVTVANNNEYVENVTIKGNCSGRALNISALAHVKNVVITGQSTAASSINLANGANGSYLQDVTLAGNTIVDATIASGVASIWIRPIFSHTSPAVDCMQLSNAISGTTTAISSGAFYKCSNALMQSGLEGFNGLIVTNTIFDSNTTVWNTNGQNSYANARLMESDYNAYFGNGTNYVNFPAEAHVFNLTTDPFTNVGAGDFSLNSTTGGGAAIAGQGFPGERLYGGYGYQSVGPLAPSGGGGGTVAY